MLIIISNGPHMLRFMQGNSRISERSTNLTFIAFCAEHNLDGAFVQIGDNAPEWNSVKEYYV